MTDKELREGIEYAKISGKYPNERYACPSCEGDCLSVEWRKQVFHCHKCEESGKMGKLADLFGLEHSDDDLDDSGVDGDGISDGDADSGGPDAVELTPRERNRLIQELADDRCIHKSYLTPSAEHSGYVTITGENGRWLDKALVAGIPRYLDTSGDKRLFWGTEIPRRGAPVWIVEGSLDALAIAEGGASAVAALLGKHLTPDQAYELRDQTVLVCMDADSKGYLAARGKVRETLESLDIPYIIVDLPEEWGKDPGEAWQDYPDELTEWVSKQELRIAPNDTDYVGRLVANEEESLIVVPTPYQRLNEIFNGGYKTGVHVIAGTPGTGKSAFCTRQAVFAAQAGTRVLYVSGELSKRQMWARVASCLPRAQEWRDLEEDMSVLTKKNQALLVGLTDNLHIRAGWTVSAICKAALDYDLIFVDYLQRLPETMHGSDDQRRGQVGSAAKALSNAARDFNKVIVCVSSMSRATYKNPKEMNIFKESGDIEYVVQSGAALLGLDSNLQVYVSKNTRGEKNTGFRLKADLGHCSFSEPIGDTVEDL